MKKLLILSMSLFAAMMLRAESQTITSPDGKTELAVELEGGKAFYSVKYEGKQMIERSALGIMTNRATLRKG